jgi:hypothetical protein
MALRVEAKDGMTYWIPEPGDADYDPAEAERIKAILRDANGEPSKAPTGQRTEGRERPSDAP